MGQGLMNLDEQLASLILSDRFREISAELDQFCPFDAMRISHSEIRHSNFLSYMLDPFAPHGLGDAPLKTFLDSLMATSGDHSLRLQLDLQGTERVEILREFRGIDLVIHLPELADGVTIIIEIKVDSKEHGNQLARYEATALAEWPNGESRFFLLSPTGMEASRDFWVPVSFPEAFDGFLAIAENTELGHPNSRQMLRSYVAMLRREFVPNENLERVAREIWKRHSGALDYLASQKPSPMRDVSSLLQAETSLNEMLTRISEQSGLTVRATSSSNTFLRLYVSEWDELEGMKSSLHTQCGHILMCEIELYGERVHIRIQMMPGDAEARLRIFEAIANEPDLDMGRCKKLTGQFTRFASKTIKRVKNIDEFNEEDIKDLAEFSRREIERFLVKHLPIYDKALRKALSA